jgi:hypothetical protein
VDSDELNMVVLNAPEPSMGKNSSRLKSSCTRLFDTTNTDQTKIEN